MTTAEILAVTTVGVLVLIIVGFAFWGVTCFLNKAAEYEEKAKRYFEDR